MYTKWCNIEKWKLYLILYILYLEILRNCEFLLHIQLYTLIYTHYFVTNLIYHPDIVLNESTGGVLSINHK